MADQTDERPHVKIFHWKEQSPILWEKNKIGASDRFWWWYDVQGLSKWFNMGCIGVLEPGQSEGFHSHMEDLEGPYECWYLVLDGEAELRTEYGDHVLSKYDAAFMVPGSSHQIRNNGFERMWYFTLSSRGGMKMITNTYDVSCSEERKGYMEEYERIQAERKKRGLPTP